MKATSTFLLLLLLLLSRCVHVSLVGNGGW